MTRDVLPAIRTDGAYIMGEEKVSADDEWRAPFPPLQTSIFESIENQHLTQKGYPPDSIKTPLSGHFWGFWNHSFSSAR